MARSSLLLPYPEFGNITYLDPVGYSWYHSLQSQGEKRFSHGFTLQVAYTWSRAMDATTFLNAQDPMPYESLSSIDRAHRVTGSGIWELPFGKGRHFVAHMPRALDFMAGGWQLSGAFQRQSGQPIDWGQMIITGDSTKLALPSDQRNVDHWFNTSIFDRALGRPGGQQPAHLPAALQQRAIRFAAPPGLLGEQDVPDHRAVQDALPRRFVQRVQHTGTAGTEHDGHRHHVRHRQRTGAAALVPVLAQSAVLIPRTMVRRAVRQQSRRSSTVWDVSRGVRGGRAGTRTPDPLGVNEVL